MDRKTKENPVQGSKPNKMVDDAIKNMDENTEETIKSERLRFKNADEIYE